MAFWGCFASETGYYYVIHTGLDLTIDEFEASLGHIKLCQTQKKKVYLFA